MNKLDRLNSLVVKIETSKLESIKSVEYSAGYFDCLKDILDQKITELNNVMTIKYDGVVRQKVYDEILPILNTIIKEDFDKKSEKVEESVEHPSVRAQNFLDRINS